MGGNNKIWRKSGNIYLGRLMKHWTCIKNVSAWGGHVRLWGPLSIVEDYYKLVGHVLIKQAKCAIWIRGKTTKVKENSTRQRQQQWHAREFWGLMK